MSKQSGSASMTILLLTTAVAMAFVFVLVAHHMDIPQDAQQQRLELLGGGSN